MEDQERGQLVGVNIVNVVNVLPGLPLRPLATAFGANFFVINKIYERTE